jgi:hypothetical protein
MIVANYNNTSVIALRVDRKTTEGKALQVSLPKNRVHVGTLVGAE